MGTLQHRPCHAPPVTPGCGKPTALVNTNVTVSKNPTLYDTYPVLIHAHHPKCSAQGILPLG